MKIRTAVALATVFALAGCGDDRSTATDAPAKDASAAATQAPAPSIAPAPTTPQAVDESKVAVLSDEEFQRAEWTRQACSLDTAGGLADGIVLTKGTPHVFSGYLVDDAQAPAGVFRLVLKGASHHAIPASTGWLRPDVAEFFKVPALSTSGFEFTTTLQEVPAGEYQAVFLIERGERLLFCESGKTVTVR